MHLPSGSVNFYKESDHNLHHCIDCGRVEELKRVQVPFDLGTIDKRRAVTGHVMVGCVALIRPCIRGHPFQHEAILMLFHKVAARIELRIKRSENDKKEEKISPSSSQTNRDAGMPTVTVCDADNKMLSHWKVFSVLTVLGC
jgi:hypothetical protein